MSETIDCMVFGAVVDDSLKRRSVTIAPAERMAAGRAVTDYLLTVGGEIRGRFNYEGGLYCLLDAAGRKVVGVPIALSPHEFEGIAHAAFAKRLLPSLAQAMTGLLAGARQPEPAELARVAHRLDGVVFGRRGNDADSESISDTDGVTLGEIRALLACYAASRLALTVMV